MPKKFKKVNLSFKKSSKKRSRKSHILSSSLGYLVIPRKYSCKMRTSMNVIAPGGAAASGYRFATIYGNVLNQPFNTGSSITTTGSLLAFNGIAMTGNIITDNCAGYNLMNTMYQTYRIISSTLKVTCVPEANADPILMVVLPFNNTNTTSISTMSLQDAQQTQYAKSVICSPNNNLKGNTIVSRHSSYNILGITQKQYEYNSAIGATIANGPSSQYQWNYCIAYGNANNTALSVPCVFKVDIDFVVEFSNPNLIN